MSGRYPDDLTADAYRQQFGPDTLAEQIAIETQCLADEIACLGEKQLLDISVRLGRVADDGKDPCHRDRSYTQQIEATLVVVRAAILALERDV